MELLGLYYDVLIKILQEIEPEDLAALSQTSQGFNQFVKNNTSLYKAHYLRNFDDPRTSPADKEPDWISSLQKFVRCRKILQSESETIKVAPSPAEYIIDKLTPSKADNFDIVYATLQTLLANGSENDGQSLNREELSSLFSRPQNVETYMHRSSLYQRAGTEFQWQAPDLETRQKSAKLHCFYGIPNNISGRRVLSTHPFARSRVYDLRNYNKFSRWGPFRTDGTLRVDWEIVESIMIVLGYNNGTCARRYIDRFTLPWSEPFGRIFSDRFARLPSTASSSPLNLLGEPSLPLDLRDPYHVSGVWARVVCFLDYDDMFHFNFNPVAARLAADDPLPPITMEEAIRHIVMRLTVTDITAPGKHDHQSMPVVHFAGPAMALDTNMDANTNHSIRGCVRMTPEGEIRWSTVWVFNGHEERWRSEAVQVGGLHSKRGVVGVWYDKSFDPHGPAGPTAFWKLREVGPEDDEGGENNWWEI